LRTSTRNEIGLRRLTVGPARADSSGFTLVELAVVLTIIVILFSAFRPGIAGILREADERTALRQLVGMLSYARTEAVGSGRLVRVVCEPRDGVFRAEAQSDPRGDRSKFDLLYVLGRSKVSLPASLTIASFTVSGQESTDQASQLYFYPDGRTDGLTLTLVGDPDRETIIELSPATGRVTASAQ
jgi:prepilin-type N-terminal cleavage/methylation domain-containing protein